MPIADTFKIRHFRCDYGHTLSELRWGKAEPLVCPSCSTPTIMRETGYPAREPKSAAVHGDEIDIEIRHGLCNEDGTPKRYTSLSELKRDAYEKGFSVHGDTPNPNPRIVEERHRAKEEGRPSRL